MTDLREALGDTTADFVEGLISEAEAMEGAAQRRARYWLTNLAICARVTKLTEYVEKIDKNDIRFLRARLMCTTPSHKPSHCRENCRSLRPRWRIGTPAMRDELRFHKGDFDMRKNDFTNDSTQSEKREVLKGEREATTYFQMRHVADEPRGRFAVENHVAGSEPSVEYPRLPSGPWSSGDVRTSR